MAGCLTPISQTLAGQTLERLADDWLRTPAYSRPKGSSKSGDYEHLAGGPHAAAWTTT